MMLAKLGIDVAKRIFEVAFVRGEKLRHQKFANAPAGFHGLTACLTPQGPLLAKRCRGPTGQFTQPRIRPTIATTGKAKLVIVGAAMRKRLPLASGMLKAGQPFTNSRRSPVDHEHGLSKAIMEMIP